MAEFLAGIGPVSAMDVARKHDSEPFNANKYLDFWPV
jgi:hypothetical protein